MLNRLTISKKITALVTTVVIFTVIAISLLSYKLAKNTIRNGYIENLTVIADSKSDKLETYFNHHISNLKLLQNSQTLQEGVKVVEASSMGMGMDMGGAFDFSSPSSTSDETDDFTDESAEEFSEQPSEDDFSSLPMAGGFDDMDSMPTEAPLEDMGMVSEMSAPASNFSDEDINTFISNVKSINNYEDIYIANSSGKVLYSTDQSKSNISDPSLLTETLSGINFSNIHKDTDLGIDYVYASAPVTLTSGNRALLFLKVNMASVYSELNDSTGLGKTGEVILARIDTVSKIINFLNHPRNVSDSSFKTHKEGELKFIALKNATRGQNGAGYSMDYRGKETVAAWRFIPNVKWGLVAKIDNEEIFQEIDSFLYTLLGSGLVIVVISTLISLLFSNFLTRPLDALKKTLELVGNGILPEKVEKKSNDELGTMALSLNYLVQTLKRTAHFAQQIGEGNFDANFKPISEEDDLGISLVNMRDNLIEAEKRDKQRNWIVTGVAEIGEILRAHDNLETLGDETIKYIINKIGAVQGAFYVINDDEEIPALEMASSFAYNRKKHLKGKFRFAEGLIGQAAAEKDTILRTEIPADYVTITSGILGDKRPTCILIVPLITDEKVYGVLEFAGFGKFDQGKVRFVEELSLILARTVFNIKVNERTRKLLQESQTMSAELQEKQEILRQNAEEMQATQEELQNSNNKLEEQIEEVNRTQKRMQLLLENASEVITIYEEDETIRYISPSVEPILGFSQKEMMGISDINKVHPDGVEAFKNMFKVLKENPEEQVTIQYEYKTKEGNYIWLESTGTNFMSNPAIHGLIVNSTDITERRRAEQEQRMRSKMQALSENSVDLIARLESDSISYINPVIEDYTGRKPVDYLNHKVSETDLHQQVLESWLKIVEEVNTSNSKITTEMDFPSEMGDRVMQVNAIPEYDESEVLESVLVVSHDITDRKIIELEIQNKNKKIADSINYAKRIQNAILPNNVVINKVLPDSFILYKPKDVVSGDFPWYVQVGEDIYMAAVDCTGHGVPGALLSLIGYFLLNDIVRSRKISDPGLILDQLDEGVTTTLRQDQDDSKTKDGMDIALCKINVKKQTVEYSGAHRPLYVIKDGEMQEIKGNKFAIGGGIYKNQTNFTNHKISLSKGDSFFFCSDGFPDQFGGPDNRKFGPKRTRELISEIHDKPMQEAYKIIDKEWEDWKSDEKQTDDVLLIGIKF
ncbi:SpoIIE family protein phosphatase [Fulvivirga sediminis]|uniref:PAS domain S-box protein n=1 Tax=Fulvivirga sediminis TaxID=2803949 RepID=A0A937F4X0_9BACT|nr:SpoIIE family protein phosphatase [Fulvivirga sediminis]MBL3656462.1 PAS domain S-box protein [Fulvivirga sediminis]